ncbi:MAG: CBS domain-containing protein [Halobacteriaceae archaeon]
MLVREVMSTDLVTLPSDATLRDAAVAMLRNRVGSVVVCAAGAPTGVVTESDALDAAVRAGRPLGEVPVDRVVEGFVVTVTADATTRKAVALMRDHDVKKLPVLDGVDLVGIVTMTDLVYAQPDLLKERRRIERRRRDYPTE